MAMYFGVPLTLAVFAIPNLLTNVRQAWRYRKEQLPLPFMLMFAEGRAVGTLIGTILLARLLGAALTLIVACAVFVYVGFRVVRPGCVLRYPLAEKLSLATGLLGGTLFGASGLSAPVTLSFLNAMRLERRQFIATVTMLFTMMGAVQSPTLFAYGIMDEHRLLVSTAAILPIVAFTPVGSWLARHISRDVFDKLILILLTAITIRLIVHA